MVAIVVIPIALIGSLDEGPAGSTSCRAALIGSAHAVGMGGSRLVARILIGAGQASVGSSNASAMGPTVVGHAPTWWV